MRFWTFLIVRLTLAIAIVAWAYTALLTPSSGDKEFRRTLEAFKTVRTVHYSMVGDVPTQHTEEEGDLICDDDSFYRATHVVRHDAGNDAKLDIVVLRTAGQDYRLMNNGMWKRDYAGLEPAKTTCQRLAQGTPAWIVPDVAELLRYGIIEKGDKKTVNGDVCREWRVTMRVGGVLERRTLCLGVKDHLPREMSVSMQAARWTYAFNVPAQIETPENVMPEPDRNNYQPPPAGLTLSNDKDD